LQTEEAPLRRLPAADSEGGGQSGPADPAITGGRNKLGLPRRDVLPDLPKLGESRHDVGGHDVRGHAVGGGRARAPAAEVVEHSTDPVQGGDRVARYR